MSHATPPQPEDTLRALAASPRRPLSRRELLALFGAAGGALALAACQTSAPAAPAAAPTLAPPTGAAPVPTVASTPTALAAAAGIPTCVVVPAQTEGPYFVDLKLDRSDIRSDPSDGSVREGAPLSLGFRVAQVGANACTPVPGAVVDIWQCDAAGVYSGVRDGSTVGRQFLRGHQVTDAQGRVQFQTIYPGWYPGRAVHIHFKVRTNPAGARGAEFTSQLYFDDAFTDQVYTRQPYATRGSGRTRNSADGIYRSGGQELTLQTTPQGQGYAAVFDLGLRA